MIVRDLANELARCAQQYPCVLVTGPRQSGKTTLCRAQYPDKPYVSLEPLDTRSYAREDPRGFLAQYAAGAIVDEIQRAPELLGYLQESVDADPTPGRFVLTGSQQLALGAAVSQSLAGRLAVLHLLPPSYAELRRFADAPDDLWETLFKGAYPRIFDRGIPATRWLRDYVATYVQRDVRQALNVNDLTAFTTFLRLCAGSSGQELNLTRLGADAGISQPTARAWLSVLDRGCPPRAHLAAGPRLRRRVLGPASGGPADRLEPGHRARPAHLILGPPCRLARAPRGRADRPLARWVGPISRGPWLSRLQL